jgi:uncharacterized protein (DUF885 family)
MIAAMAPNWAPIRAFVLTLCLVSIGGCATNRFTSPAPRQLDAIFDDYFEAYLKLYPTFASEIGDHRYDADLEIAIADTHIAEQKRLAERTLERLGQIPLDELDQQRRLFFDVLRYNLRDTLEGFRFKLQLLPVRQLANLAVEFPLLTSPNGIHPFNTLGDYDNFLRRMERFESWIDAAIGNMRLGIKSGIVQPGVVIERALPQLEAMIVTDAKVSLFYGPILRLPSSFSAADRERLTRVYVHAIEHRLVPAYRRLVKFLREEYLPKTRPTVAWSKLPDGGPWYDYWVKNQTTLEIAPEEIYALGMTEVARIKSEMDQLRRASGFQGTLSEYSRYLANYRSRVYSNRAELISGYEEIARAVLPHLGKLFDRLPKARFEVRTVEEYREQAAPSQYWSAAPDGSRPGIFYVNARGIEASPRRASEPLFLHEAIPGHHFQISLQREQDGAPRFQRFADYTAFTEGWALYAESLGAELGLYTEASQNFSRLNSELFRAARLVVDVGLHRKGWSREQAIHFIVETTGGSESGASLEVDRYIAVPAQALGYKIGQLKISALRAKAEKALGNGFDIRKFHDELLKDGALPLTILEAKMDRWIARSLR